MAPWIDPSKPNPLNMLNSWVHGSKSDGHHFELQSLLFPMVQVSCPQVIRFGRYGTTNQPNWTKSIKHGWLDEFHSSKSNDFSTPYLPNSTSYGHDTPFDTTKIEVFLEDMPAPIDPCEPNPRIMVDFRGPYLKIWWGCYPAMQLRRRGFYLVQVPSS